MDKKAGKDSRIEGEGSYSATRDYNEATARFLKKGKVDEAAKEAERVLESQEGAELRSAEEKGIAGDPRHLDAGDVEKAPAKPKSRSKSKSK
jgi:hypothetical protein